MKEKDERKAEVIRQFGRNAGKYVTSQSHAKGDDLALIVEWLPLQPDWQILDVATGGGHVARTLAPHVRHVVAADLTKNMLQAAAEHNRANGIHNVSYVLADAEDLPFLDGAFDLVTCRIAAHHFPDPAAFVREAGRVLRPGGWFLLIDNVSPDDDELARFHNSFELLRDPSHVRCASIAEWRGWLTAAGLDEVKSRLRKKTYPFPEWVARTTAGREQAERVEAFILGGDERIREAFAVEVREGRVQSLQVDEWLVIARRQPAGDGSGGERNRKPN